MTSSRPSLLRLSVFTCITLLVLHGNYDASAQATPAKPDPAAIEFLIAASAEDFKAPGSIRPIAIRKTRVGYFAEAGTGNYLLCGSFRSSEGKGSDWIEFATIKTSPYEQWIGGMAEAQCANKRIRWFAGDHADELMRRVLKK